ncbi:tRNA 2-selenouridine(34) synthase MnmH [Metallumcola ferriviriculae]|uniref:tRNA 2-selenouridine(34) synthase MnmH n=1 Tax=Metallumcola ferriviriculae TaxID=3039180 RepID=A0AAU0UST5_9FIRM|nr:tRNA 2-selenouridine(34) synthase MnmH [Desulfitibacteraceae bacterium MK1]
MKEITVEDALESHHIYVDLRSPSEYAEDHLPGAVNLPLFNDEERAKVGTVYKQEGSLQAKRLGLEFVSLKLPRLIKEISDQTKGGPVVIYCWRGGLRSKSVSNVLEIMGVPTRRLQGGYKAFRRHVNNYFQETIPYKMVVIHGFTGTGKTDIIKILQSMDYPAIDLEGLANNRGSVFGEVGLGEQPAQKHFETRIFSQLTEIPVGSTIVVEGESKRIGKNFIPESFFNAMKKGKKIMVQDDINNRVKRIISEYSKDTQENRDALIHSLSFLTKRIGKSKVEQLTEMVIAGNYAPVVEYLLNNYYDPLYAHPFNKSDEFDIIINGANPVFAANDVLRYLNYQ